MNSRDNTIGKILRIMAWIDFVLWFILGLVLGIVNSHFTIMVILYWAIGFVSGIFLLGFAEVIFLLQEIANKKVVINQEVKATVSERKTNGQNTDSENDFHYEIRRKEYNNTEEVAKPKEDIPIEKKVDLSILKGNK